jgi:hypothetical protein
MNRSKLKTYAPKARKEFIQAVTDRAASYGLTKDEVLPISEKGDVAIIGGKAFPRSVAEKRRQLEDRIERKGPNGFEQVMEAVAYTWFNRLVAIRYMELHGYLDHGYRVLSHPEGKSTPEIVEHAEHVELPGLNKQKVIDLKLDGTKESELFRMLLIAQCNALHSAMPFLFERIDDETELLLPDNLLHSDSIVRKLVSEIEEADWQQVEIIGWLYQFYISDKKDEVMGKVVKSEDIPAATQLFTPNWIVKYLVQNSLGRQWLATYPDSTLKAKWEYYIEPAEQTPEVQAKLKEITPTTLNPEALTIMDPACGSGHILVEAYDLLKDIYLERGYRLRDIPRLILTKNVFGLEIDDRAAQLSCFALLMKAREDDRRIFDPPPQLNVLAIQETKGLPFDTIVQAFTDKRITKDDDLPSGEFGFMVAERAPLFVAERGAASTKVDEQIATDLKSLLTLFEDAKTYGSLITVPAKLSERLPAIGQSVRAAQIDDNLAVQSAARIAAGVVMAATLLAKRYDAVVANPPYMGSLFPTLSAFAKRAYPDSRADLFAMFVERGFAFANRRGTNAQVTMQSWMFLPSFQELREMVLRTKTIASMVHIGYNSFPSMNSKVARATAFVLLNDHHDHYAATFIDLNSSPQSADKQEVFLARDPSHRFNVDTTLLGLIPGSPLAYWVSDSVRLAFGSDVTVAEYSRPLIGMRTGDNARFLRRWHEVAWNSTSLGALADPKWFPYAKGGEYRRWYGNYEYFVNWRNDGYEIKENTLRIYPDLDWDNLGWKISNEEHYFKEAITWTCVSSSPFAARHVPPGSLFDTGGSFIPFAESVDNWALLCYLNSKPVQGFLDLLNPTINYGSGTVGKLPWPDAYRPATRGTRLVQLGKSDWDSYERSWDFKQWPAMKSHKDERGSLRVSYERWLSANAQAVSDMRRFEVENNQVFIKAFNLTDELDAEVAEEDVTLTVNPSFRYGLGSDERERNGRFQRDSFCELMSYAVGCALGRYSLDKPGLIYANSGNEGFDPSQYKTFPADPDGIIPVTDFEWFSDSASRRFEEFVSAAWPKEHLEENLQFVADSLTGKSGVDARETIRSYFAKDFYKHHLQTYKKRPIYWLFSSGNQRAFQALVYLHRYHEGTLARMRTEYVIPLQGKITSRISQLEGDIAKATSSAHTKKLTKEKDALVKQQTELREFDEKLRHYADQRIKLDLDDGVKVNYGKFGDLLADVKAICGDKEDEE